MRPVYTAERVRALDRALIEGLGVPGAQLMELAGRGAAEILQARHPQGPVAVLCGPGNNGGDGYVIARWLSLWGREVRLWASSPPTTADATTNRALCERMGIPLLGLMDALRGATVCVDALLGTGQRSAPRGSLGEGVAALQGRPGVVAIDLPTGVDADSGQKLGNLFVSAELTITLGALKPGVLYEPGATLAGELAVVDIGLGLARLHDPSLGEPDAAVLEEADVRAWAPRLAPGAAKWDRGHVAIRAAGGAAVLAAHGALRSGAGLVTLLAPRRDWDRLHGLLPEVILAEPGALDSRRHDVLVLGPALGLGEAEREEVLALWAEFPGPLVVDADALTLLGAAGAKGREGPSVLTPHAAEAGRLLGRSRAEVEADRLGAARALGALVGPKGAALLKGRNTAVAGPAGLWVNPTGSPKLAVGGSGDVLAGMVGALLGAGLEPQRAAALAAWRHGRAGERLPDHGGPSDLLAILRDLPN